MTTGGSRADQPIMGYEAAKDALDLNTECERLRRQNAELLEALEQIVRVAEFAGLGGPDMDAARAATERARRGPG